MLKPAVLQRTRCVAALLTRICIQILVRSASGADRSVSIRAVCCLAVLLASPNVHDACRAQSVIAAEGDETGEPSATSRPDAANESQPDAANARATDSVALFDDRIAELLSKRCVECHRSDRKEGGLSLSSVTEALAGGDSGPAIVSGDVESSFLLDMVQPTGAGNNEPPEMPKGRPPLSATELADLKQWIASGAGWPEGRTLTPRDGTSGPWWSLAPLARTPPPPPARGSEQLARSHWSWTRGPIDAFVSEMHQKQGLKASPEANPRQWLRRVTFDLTGLPPTPEALDEFEADRAPDARERIIDRLLASPAYGERAARRWLDVVHYGETHGYDKDKPRPHAWPYRDYVIRAFNEDRAYSRFVQEQIAGDVLTPESPSAVEALGFLSAGPWDFIGHAEVPESKLDGKLARHLDRDDMVQNTMLTFQSITVGCAQCHDHKFDPVSQREYYGLQAVFAALDRADRSYYRDPAHQATYWRLTAERERLRGEQATIDQQIQAAAGPQLKMLDEQLVKARAAAGTYPPEHGYHSHIVAREDDVKWVQIDFGKVVELLRVEWIACHDDFAGIGDGFGAPRRFKLELALDPDIQDGVEVLADHTQADYPPPGITPQRFDAGGKRGRYLRMTATRLAHRQNDFIFALAELEAIDSSGINVAAGATVSALDSIEAPVRWAQANLVDGKAPRQATSAEEIERLEQQRQELIAAKVPQELTRRAADIGTALAANQQELSALPAADHVYVATIHHGAGTFTGTGPSGGRPRPIHVLARGDLRAPGDPAAPRTLDCLENLPATLGDLDSSDAERRVALAHWLSAPQNPLTWRSIANRIWLAHFGRGIVSTPNDFGRMGEQPTHPELLEWLATEMRDTESIKRLHRQIALSATYGQAPLGGTAEEVAAVLDQDPDNRWLSRAARKRLDAEAIRDTLLSVGGVLDRAMGGPSYQDFVIERPEHSPHYEYRLHDPRDPTAMRRAVYRMIVRSQTQPMLTSLDCADPSIQVDVRTESNSPTQALTLLNNPFSLMAASRWAERAQREVATLVPGEGPSARATTRTQLAIARLWELAMGRKADEAELTALEQHAGQHGLEGVARVIFNLNEFLYVD
jgi:cytochrome c551/c552